jgi:hypothetical protein
MTRYITSKICHNADNNEIASLTLRPADQEALATINKVGNHKELQYSATGFSHPAIA